MPMKGPAMLFFESFGRGLGNIMEDGRPAEPMIIGLFGYIVQYLEGVLEIILMPQAIDIFRSGELDHLGENDL